MNNFGFFKVLNDTIAYGMVHENSSIYSNWPQKFIFSKNMLGGCESFVDNDNDGYYSNVDCDDSNPQVFPGALEVPCNGIDENCNGMDDDIVIFDPSFSVTTICSGDRSMITVTPSNNGQIYWYDNPSGSSPIDSGTVFITPFLRNNTVYYFEESKDSDGPAA